MKKLIIISIAFLTTITMNSNAQETSISEKFGNTLNLGAGMGYYKHIGHAVPLGTLNFEFDIARNFTLAPFVGIYSYQDHYYWGNPEKPFDDPSYRKYSYRAIAIPAGAKGTYYFDQLFHANQKWDFYAAGSLGFIFRSAVWENGYEGDKHVYQSASPLFLDAHIGAEYHFSQKAGLFLDLSSGISTFGLAIHF